MWCLRYDLWEYHMKATPVVPREVMTHHCWHTICNSTYNCLPEELTWSSMFRGCTGVPLYRHDQLNSRSWAWTQPPAHSILKVTLILYGLMPQAFNHTIGLSHLDSVCWHHCQQCGDLEVFTLSNKDTQNPLWNCRHLEPPLKWGTKDRQIIYE